MLMTLAAAFKKWPVGKQSRCDKSNKGKVSAEKAEVSKGSRGIGGRRREKEEGKVRRQPRVPQEQAHCVQGCWVLVLFKGPIKESHVPFDTFIFLSYTHTLSPSLSLPPECKSSFPSALWLEHAVQWGSRKSPVGAQTLVLVLWGLLSLLSWSQQQSFNTICISDKQLS